MNRLSEIKYKPVSVRKLLKNMKDISELMIDLAYSAALFHSKQLAEEVLKLEVEIDTLVYQLTMHTMLAARDAEDAEALLSVAVVTSAVDKISDAAADIARFPLIGVEIHPIVRKAFQKVEEHLTRVEVELDSSFVGKTIGELDLAPKIGVDIIAIRRGASWMLNPEKQEIIRKGDVLIARGAAQGINEFQKVAMGTIEQVSETLSEKLPERVSNEITEKLVQLKNNSEIMLDLSYSSLILNSKQLANEVKKLEEYMDELHTTFEYSVLSSGFNQYDSKNFLGLIRIGVVTEQIADAAFQIAEVVMRGLKPHPILKKVIEEADETVVRMQVMKDSPLIGKSFREAAIPEKTGMWILAIRRGNTWIRPTPSGIIREGDTLIASGYSEGEDDLAGFSLKPVE